MQAWQDPASSVYHTVYCCCHSCLAEPTICSALSTGIPAFYCDKKPTYDVYAWYNLVLSLSCMLIWHATGSGCYLTIRQIACGRGLCNETALVTFIDFFTTAQRTLFPRFARRMNPIIPSVVYRASRYTRHAKENDVRCSVSAQYICENRNPTEYKTRVISLSIALDPDVRSHVPWYAKMWQAMPVTRLEGHKHIVSQRKPLFHPIWQMVVITTSYFDAAVTYASLLIPKFADGGWRKRVPIYPTLIPWHPRSYKKNDLIPTSWGL